MIEAKNILRSTKAYGKYEKPLISRLKSFFVKRGYVAVPHARLNIAWGSIISDLDLVLVKNNALTIVEVKSSRDSIKRAQKQIHNVQNFVDFAYVAVERIPKNWKSDHRYGLITISASRVKIVQEASSLRTIPTMESM